MKKNCITSVGMEMVDSIKFSSNYDEVTKLISQTSEMLGIINDGLDFPLDTFENLTPALMRISTEGTFLTPEELFSLQKIFEIGLGIYSFFQLNNADTSKISATRYESLKGCVENLETFPQLIRLLNNVLDKYGEVKDSASPKLRELRTKLQNTSAGINSKLRKILVSARENGYVEKDVTPSMRDGRLVIPVSPMFKRKISGIVHDESASGKTIFIEPSEIVEANNKVRELENEIKREILRILAEVAYEIRPFSQNIIDSITILGYLDFVRAKALCASQLGAHAPHINPDSTLEWYGACHPMLLLALRVQNHKVVPLNIQLTKTDRILLISGPNAGGKSVALKTVAINQYMLQCGFLPIVYENSHFGIFSDIFIDIGDQQSIEDDLSTYSSHLSNMKVFMEKARSSSLVLIDEFGSGTEPQIGGALAQSILKNINEKKAYGVITTHYTNLKQFAENMPGLINGAMLYDRQLMKPLFQLSIGYPGSSFAIEIARKIGLPQSVISEAESIVGSVYVNLDKYVLDIARDRRYWENKRQQIRIKDKKLSDVIDQYSSELEQLKLQQKDIMKKAKTEAGEILNSANAAIERTVHEIKKVNAEREQTKHLRKELEDFKKKLMATDDTSAGISKFEKKLPQKFNKKSTENTKNIELNKLAVGDNVTLEDSESVGTIVSIEGNNAVITFGGFRTKVDLSRLKKSIKKATDVKLTSESANSLQSDSHRRLLNFSHEIDVRGMRTNDALQAVTYFIDDAISFNAHRVRILHGTGNGILRQNIRVLLNTIEGVRSYHDEHVQFGGSGITVVELD